MLPFGNMLYTKPYTMDQASLGHVLASKHGAWVMGKQGGQAHYYMGGFMYINHIRVDIMNVIRLNT